jgi:sec-independent protein translocase protein TatA
MTILVRESFPLLWAFLGGTVGPGEMLVVLLALLLLFGAKRLPAAARSLGRAMDQLRRASDDVRDQILKAGNEEPAAEPKRSATPIPAGPPAAPTESASDTAANAKEEGHDARAG